jgi:hypothetical protein
VVPSEEGSDTRVVLGHTEKGRNGSVGLAQTISNHAWAASG